MRMRMRSLPLGLLVGFFLTIATTSAWADPVRYLDETITLGSGPPPHPPCHWFDRSHGWGWGRDHSNGSWDDEHCRRTFWNNHFDGWGAPVTKASYEFDAPSLRTGRVTITRTGKVTGTIKFNGQEIVHPSDLGGFGPLTLVRTVTFVDPFGTTGQDPPAFNAQSNQLDVRVTGKPGSTLDIAVTVAPETSALIPAATGGCLSVDNPESPILGAELCIPPDSLAHDTDISIYFRDEPLPSPDPNLVASSLVVELEPSGIVFQAPATLRIPYFGVVSPENQRLFVQEVFGGPIQEVTPITVDTMAEMIETDVVSTFSAWGSFVPLPPLNLARVSVDSNGAQANSASGGPIKSISDDAYLGGVSTTPNGRYVAFASNATNLIPGDTTGFPNPDAWDIFVHDRDCDAPIGNPCPAAGNGIYDQIGGIRTVRVSVDSLGTEAIRLFFGQIRAAQSFYPSISADGRFVAFQSDATNLVPGDTNGITDIFVHDRDCDAPIGNPCVDIGQGDGLYDQPGRIRTIRLSVNSAGNQAAVCEQFAAVAMWPSISADGRHIAFFSQSEVLVQGQPCFSPFFAAAIFCAGSRRRWGRAV